MSVVDLLRELVRIPSESGREDAVAARLEEIFESFGWRPRREGRNLWILLGESGPLLLLNSHTDTVPAGEGWTRAPFAAESAQGRIYGRGANDAKGCLAAMICAARRVFSGSGPVRGRLCLAATCEEEINGEGLQKLRAALPGPDAAVIGEPTGLAPAVAQKGLLILEVTSAGVSAHAAWGGGKNAIEAAARDVLALSRLSFERGHPVLGRPSLHVTQIQGGERHNVIPDRCRFVLDIRTTPSYTVDEIVERVRASVGGEVRVRSSRLAAAVATDPAHPIVQAALAANPRAKPYGSPTLSDWVFLPGIAAIKAGPGDSRRSHTPDEYIEASELEEGVLFYEELIRRYFAAAGA